MVLDSAEEDISDGHAFYEKEQMGIGDYFFDSISSDIDSLPIHNGRHRIFFGFHRLLAKTFTFSIHYRIVDETIFIDTVLNRRGNPQTIRNLLRRRRRSG